MIKIIKKNEKPILELSQDQMRSSIFNRLAQCFLVFLMSISLAEASVSDLDLEVPFKRLFK